MLGSPAGLRGTVLTLGMHFGRALVLGFGLLVAGYGGAFAQGKGKAPAGCVSGSYTSEAALDERIAACSILIDGRNTPQRLAILLSTRAQNLMSKMQCDLGIADLDRARDISPSKRDPNYYNLLLWTAFYWQHCKGDLPRAIAIFSDAAGILPRDPAAYNGRANVLSDMGAYDEALADMNKAIPLVNNNPNRASTYNGRGLIWGKKGEPQRAIADFNIAIQLNPTNPKYVANRGEAWRLAGDLDRALADHNRAIEMYAGGSGVDLGLTLRGDTYRYRGEYERALADYNEATRITPQYIPPYTARGLTYERMGQFDRAKAEFQKALTVNTESGRGDLSKSARETAEARLAGLASGAPQPVFLPTPGRATSATSVPTPVVATPVVSAAVAKATAAKQGRRVALVIGNSAYTAIPALTNPRRDAEKVASSLRAIGFDTVTVASDASREKLMETLRSFAAAADKSDWAMVYYAGHGIEVNGINYLVPVDAKLTSDRDVMFAAVPLDQVMAAIDGAKKLKLVMLDACRDNPFAAAAVAAAAAAPQPASVTQAAADGDASRSLRTRSAGRGLSEVKVAGASLVVYAAKHGQTALDGEGENSPFAVAVVQRLATPGVEINKVFRLVRDDVMEATAGRQEPFTYGSLPGREDFFFVAR
jgi:tetratricopeptide (TPR) repeat protein